MSYNPTVHHRKSIRLKGYDYSQEGLYFITICCKKKECMFGQIELVENSEAVMQLNEAGKIAKDCWLQIPKHFPNAVLHEYIIMPNHIHGIIELMKPDGSAYVGAENFQPLQTTNRVIPPKNEFQKIIPRSIGSIIRGYKTGVTKWFRSNSEIYTVWQRNYYEHIIRNEQSYHKISNYITNNPAKWSEDKFYVAQANTR
jgi:putative transposase